MTQPLPDVDETGYDDWQNKLYTEDVDRKIQGLAFNQQANDRMADLQRIGTWASAPAPELPTPEPAAPAPEPAPQPQPEPEPVVASAAPATAPAIPPNRGAASPPAAEPSPAAAAPDWENQVFGQALGAVSQAGGDVQAFADRFGTGLRGAQNAQSVFGTALGAAAAAGADVQAFADRFQPPERPVERPAAVPSSLPGSLPGVGGGTFQDYARQAAAKAGIDPEIFARQIQQESGFNPNARSPAGATGIAQFMPGTAQGMGIDPTDPYQSLDAGAKLMASHLKQYGGDYAKALAAYNAGPGNVAKYGGVPPFEETQRYVSTILGGAQSRTAPTPTEGLGRVGVAQAAAARDVSQFGDPQLTNDEAYAACGPAAAVRFAQRFGRNPSLREATDLARSVGWTSAQGMAGLASEKSLMDKLGVATRMVGADWKTIANEAQTGNPVTISTQGHYFTADGYDPQSNRFHVGRSGLDLKGGSEWMTPEQMTAAMGGLQGALFADNPQVASPSTADLETNTANWFDRARKTMSDSLGGAQNMLQQGIIDPLKGALSLESTPEPRDLETARLDGAVMQAASTPGGARPLLATPPTEVAGVQAPPVQPAQPEASPVEKLKSAFGDFIDSMSGNANQGAAATGAVPAPGGGYDPSALRAETAPPQPGIPQRQDIRDLNQPAQPTIFEQIGEAPGLSEADRAARRQALEESPLGQLYGSDIRRQLLPNITEPNHPINVMAELQEKYGTSLPSDQMTPEDQQRAREAQLFIGGMASPVGVTGPLKTGEGMLAEALGQLKGYPEEMAGPIRQWANTVKAPASSIAQTVQRWIEENPATAAHAAVTETPEVVAQVVKELNTTLRSVRARPRGGAAGSADVGGGGGGLARGDVYRPSSARLGQLLEEPATEISGLNLPNYVPESVRRILGRGWDETSTVAQSARTGTIEEGLLDDLAGAAKTTTDRARAVLKLDDPENSKTAYVLKQAFDDQAQRIRQAQLALRAAPDDLNATRTLVRELAGQRALQETVAGVEPKAGRALDSFRYTEQLSDMAKRFKMLPDEFISHLRDDADFTDPATIADVAKKAYGYTFKDKAMAVWYFNLLSNPLTHIRNGVANTVSSLTAPVEGAGASLLDPLARKMLGDTGPRQRYIQEFPAEYVGMLSALPDSARQGIRRLKLGVSDRATGGSELVGGRQVSGPISEALGGGLKNPINYPGRALAASDDFFRGANEGASLHGLANRVARQEGHTGEALTDRIAELIKRPTEDMLDEIGKVGEYRVFQQENAWANKINNIRGDSVLGRFLLPFTKTPLNLMSFVLERSPVGGLSIAKDFATKGGRAALREKGAGDLADRMSRTAIGTTVWGALAKQAFEGNLTGKMPRDPTERDAFRREGKQPYSFRNPIDGKWTSYLPLSPFSTMFSAAANVADAHQKGEIENPDDIGMLGLRMGLAFADGITDTQWTEQLSDALEIVNGGAADPADAVTKFATRQAATINPGILRGFARATDDVLRDPDNPIEGFLAGNPFTQGMVDAQLNAWGEPIRRPTSGAEAFINPFNPSEPTQDKVELELHRLSQNKAYDVEPSFVSGTASVLGQDTKMTEAQQRHYQQLSGYLAKTMLDILIPSAEYEAMSDPDKAKMIKDIYEATRKTVRESMQPEMFEQSIEARIREARAQAAVAKPTATPTATPEAGTTPPSPVPTTTTPRPGGVIRGGGPVRPGGSPVPRP